MWETRRCRADAGGGGGVAAFHVSGGVIDRLVTRMVNGADDGDGLAIGAAAAVRQVVDVPVIAVGRLHDPALAERVLAEGRADFVAMARPLLADPDLPRENRLRAGAPGPALHLLRELHRLARAALLGRLRRQRGPAREGLRRKYCPGPPRGPQHVVVPAVDPVGWRRPASRPVAATR